MKLQYRRIDHLIQFLKPISFPTLPTFLFRSIVGKELKHLTCIFRGRPCSGCGLKYTCAYSWMFETPLETQPDVLEGRDRGSHPFLLSVNRGPGEEVQNLILTVTLFGKAIEYYPYLYYALLQAGKSGVLRDRIPFEIQDLSCEGQSILLGKDSIHPSSGIQCWELSPSHTNSDTTESRHPYSIEEKVRVVLDTPLRLRIDGKYLDHFTAPQFFTALYRRAQILCSLYGLQDEKEDSFRYSSDESLRIISRSFRWVDYPYYSSRQKTLLRMGGIVGEFLLEGILQKMEKTFLQFGEIFHVGKNTAFGLGRYHTQEL
ncbi:MAG TPA: CRISPR system precrRNA processing endoribonuclease RAMP protein Cas6 [Spirochaetales bacterium]|nr:CRISPR system precrRNA processing endoribonuclease RAMP protein Cas6 [Spirochaetales bacterium]HOV39541.1 CRISPR system precrRNA processing endoribonuclease RAMP protein Cas6 [Spirochaetales bacterium]